MDRSPTQEIPFTEGAPPQRQVGYQLSDDEREMLEMYRSDADVRFQANALAYQRRNGIPAGQYVQQQAQPQAPQESELDKKVREYQEQIVPRMRELENWANAGRNLSPDELAEYDRLRMREGQANRDITALERQQTQQYREQEQVQNSRRSLEAYINKRVYETAQNRIEPMHVTVPQKQDFYRRFQQKLFNHPFYSQIQDEAAADILVNDAFNALVAEPDVPKQRSVAGRTGEQFNDADSPQPEASGPWAHLPEKERNVMAELYPSQAKVSN